jgi:RHS repeat-associated protein
LLATDQQRSVLHALKGNHPRRSIAYSPYGHRPAENGLLSLLGFNGERPDLVTGHYLLGNGYRAFNPVLMRFNSPDSLSPFGKGGSQLICILLSGPNQSKRSNRTLVPFHCSTTCTLGKTCCSESSGKNKHHRHDD